MPKLNVMQHPVYSAVHICNSCGKLKLVTEWVKFDPSYLGPETYVVPTHCPECFKKLTSMMEDKKRKRSEVRMERKIANKIRKKLT